jgi:predicted ribosomally synthesized peptide with nif11-like leader
MSLEAAHSFVERIFKDTPFREKFRQLPTNDARLQAAHEAGYDFTVAEFEQLLPPGITLDQLQTFDAKSQEVPDEILEAVSGGKGVSWDDWWVEILVGVGAETVAAIVAAAI